MSKNKKNADIIPIIFPVQQAIFSLFHSFEKSTEKKMEFSPDDLELQNECLKYICKAERSETEEERRGNINQALVNSYKVFLNCGKRLLKLMGNTVDEIWKIYDEEHLGKRLKDRDIDINGYISEVENKIKIIDSLIRQKINPSDIPDKVKQYKEKIQQFISTYAKICEEKPSLDRLKQKKSQLSRSERFSIGLRLIIYPLIVVLLIWLTKQFVNYIDQTWIHNDSQQKKIQTFSQPADINNNSVELPPSK